MNTEPNTQRPELGVLCRVLAAALQVVMGAFVKVLGHDVPIGETIFVRSLTGALALILLARVTTGTNPFKTSQPWVHARRSTLGTLSMFCYFGALTMVPLAQVAAINLTAPVFLTILAMIFLGERIHAFRWIALTIGMTGALIVTVPHIDFQHGKTLGIALAFIATLASAFTMLFVRKMSAEEPAITITLYFMLTACACALVTLAFGWVVPNRSQALALTAISVLGIAAQLLLTISYRYAEASALAPLDYSGLVFAMIVGYLAFNEQPDWSMWLGAPLIIFSGLLILWREYRLHLERNTLKVQ